MKNREKEILEELAELSPLLGQIKKQEQQLKQQQDLPKQYFEQLPELLWQQIQAEEVKVAKPARQKSVRKPWLKNLVQHLQDLLSPQLAIGFSLASLLLLAWFSFLRPSLSTPALVKQNNIPGMQELSADELYRYVLTNIEDYATEDLLEVAGAIPLEFAWPTMEEEEGLEEVIDEILEEMSDEDWSDLM